MKKNFVSILITNYNKSHYLKKTISSCLSQNFDNKEISSISRNQIDE